MDNLPAIQSPFDEPNEEIRPSPRVADRRAQRVDHRGVRGPCGRGGGRGRAAHRAAVQRGGDGAPAWTHRARQSPQAAMMYFGNENQSSLAWPAEVITSRTLASEVVDSLGLRLYVVAPPRVVRSTLISRARFAADAPSVQYRLTKVPRGTEVRVLPEDSVIGVFPDTARAPADRRHDHAHGRGAAAGQDGGRG